MAIKERAAAPFALATFALVTVVLLASARAGQAATMAGAELACGLRAFAPQQDEQGEVEKAREELEASVQEVEALPHFAEMPSRWYRDPWALLPPPAYEVNEPGDQFWDPYRQNVLKGDFPIIGEDIFLRLTLTEKLTTEFRNVPTPSGLTGPGAGNASFFGDGDQFFFSSKTALSIDLFKGQEAFRPVSWRLRITPVVDVTYLDVNELGAVNPNVEDGTDRTTGDIALQEALLEIHLFDLNSRFDFVSSELGIFGFRSDFRGFIFDDIQAGVRLFGNADENKWQYNAVFFNMLEKDTNSELNRFDWRDQQVLILNLYRQDFLVKGYTAQVSFHWNHDQRDTHFNRNDFLTRPQPIGLAREKEVDAYYLGFAGEGHFGRFNITHAFYQVFGTEENNAIAARDTDIDAQFFAIELSYDIDWARIRAYFMYASGDDDPRDGDAEGFDAIVDAPAFAGGEFSFWNRQEIRLLGIGLIPRLSFLPDLTSSKFEGQANFVNPGIMLVGGAFDAEITPEWRAQVGVNYMRFIEPAVFETYLETEDIDEEIGLEVFLGTTYRPLLTNNIIISAGASAFFPGDGMEKLYQQSQTLYSFFLDVTITY
ncbi:MAG: hypothetical protein H6807_09810 [Planctomycetes bacterium]|nr:hypothetical protein [Planctomycetota bacterium]